MKKIILTIIAFVAVIFIFIGCDKTSTAPSSDSFYSSFNNSDDIANLSKSVTSSLPLIDYENMAKIHNDGLGFVYEGLNKKLNGGTAKTASLLTREEVIEYSNQLILEFMYQTLIEQNLQISQEENEVAIEWISWAVHKDWSNISETISHINDDPNLEPIVRDYFIRIVSIQAKNYGQIVSALEIIENEARKKIQIESELNQVLGYITLTRSSVKYWKDNQDNWIEMFENAGYLINDSELPCTVTGWEADKQTFSYIHYFIEDGVTIIWGGSAIIGGSAGQAIWNWLSSD